jgi:hypothetical protein
MTVKRNDGPLGARTGWGGTVAARAWISGLFSRPRFMDGTRAPPVRRPQTESVPSGKKFRAASVRQFLIRHSWAFAHP